MNTDLNLIRTSNNLITEKLIVLISNEAGPPEIIFNDAVSLWVKSVTTLLKYAKKNIMIHYLNDRDYSCWPHSSIINLRDELYLRATASDKRIGFTGCPKPQYQSLCAAMW